MYELSTYAGTKDESPLNQRMSEAKTGFNSLASLTQPSTQAIVDQREVSLLFSVC